MVSRTRANTGRNKDDESAEDGCQEGLETRNARIVVAVVGRETQHDEDSDTAEGAKRSDGHGEEDGKRDQSQRSHTKRVPTMVSSTNSTNPKMARRTRVHHLLLGD